MHREVPRQRKLCEKSTLDQPTSDHAAWRALLACSFELTSTVTAVQGMRACKLEGFNTTLELEEVEAPDRHSASRSGHDEVSGVLASRITFDVTKVGTREAPARRGQGWRPVLRS